LTTVSLCMIVKNNEAVIERCLQSVSDLVDEVIIVDLKSTDRTRELASMFTSKIYSYEASDHEKDALSYLFELATKEYIFYLNPNDILFENDRKKFTKLKQSIHSNLDGISMKLITNLNESTPKMLTRLVNRSSNYSFHVESDEFHFNVTGKVVDSDLSINHLPYTNNPLNHIKIFEKMIEEKVVFSARDLFYYAKELSDHHQYDQSIQYFLKFLRKKQPYNEHNILACYYLADNYHHLNLFELEKSWLLHSLQYEKPQPETCCRIGYFFLENTNYDSAIFWYEEAVSNKNAEQLSNVQYSYSTWMPHLQLAVCYDRIGKHQLANEHNEMAYSYHPTHASILSNRQYFSNLLNK